MPVWRVLLVVYQVAGEIRFMEKSAQSHFVVLNASKGGFSSKHPFLILGMFRMVLRHLFYFFKKKKLWKR